MTQHAEFLYQALGIEQLVAQLEQDEHRWASKLQQDTYSLLTEFKHGDLERWLGVLNGLPAVRDVALGLDQNTITLSGSGLDLSERHQLLESLQELKPWRKGPYNIFGIDIDTEWRSDLKWQRIEKHLDLKNKTVLDVGCANGYFGWRMLGTGAKCVVGVDPGWLFIVQFLLLNHYAQQVNLPGTHALLPCRLEDLPQNLEYFDTVFSMGVLYHRRSVFDHLFELKRCLKPGGELVLETLVIPKAVGEVLVPRDRYARMRNVWFLPNADILCGWLARAGFIDIRTINETATSLEEQRKTDWLDSQSLEYCLDPKNPDLTIEGYPAPRRAILLARRPE